MAEPIDFWFSVGSTYSFLSVMRLPQVARETGIAFRWRPFNVRSISSGFPAQPEPSTLFTNGRVAGALEGV